MPVKTKKISKGKNKGKYENVTPEGVTAKATSRKKAEAQVRLVNAIKHGWRPK